MHGRRVNYLEGIGILKGLFDVTVNYQRARCGVNSQTFPSERRGRNNGVASCNHTLGRPSDRCALALSRNSKLMDRHRSQMYCFISMGMSF